MPTPTPAPTPFILNFLLSGWVISTWTAPTWPTSPIVADQTLVTCHVPGWRGGATTSRRFWGVGVGGPERVGGVADDFEQAIGLGHAEPRLKGYTGSAATPSRIFRAPSFLLPIVRQSSGHDRQGAIDDVQFSFGGAIVTCGAIASESATPTRVS